MKKYVVLMPESINVKINSDKDFTYQFSNNMFLVENKYGTLTWQNEVDLNKGEKTFLHKKKLIN